MEQLTCERLQDNLQRLKLARAAEVLEAVAGRAGETQASYFAFLDHLLEEEVAAREKRRLQTALKIASLPFAKTIEEYDFSFHPHLDKKAVMELFDLTFLPKHENVVFLGPPGIGKTHLAVALAIKACSHGFKVYFTTMSTLIGKLKEPQSKGKAFLSAILDRLLHHSRVINIKGHSYRLKDHGFRQPSYPKEGGETVSATPA
ncbi:MAG: ATP-binding protein [Acidobacteriota bacterium]|nr:ATP-binding protein [Acidobacteriota bacterium]MDD8033937.1 ATP-binding protein [Acidobacteriota bacterium]MDD8038500.1 ATP-binding protein [Acidobacteriota bacterium]